MSKMIRSARGELIDFELLAIKQQLAAAKPPKTVEDRKIAIDIKDGVKQKSIPVIDAAPADVNFLALSNDAANLSSTAAGKQIKRK